MLNCEHQRVQYCLHFPPFPFLTVPWFVSTRFLFCVPWSKCRQNWESQPLYFPVLAEVTHCHHWSVNVYIRNRGRRANPSFSVVQQSPSVTDTGSWLTRDCLSGYCVVFSGLGKTLVCLATCKDLPGPGPCLWQQSQVIIGGDPDLLPGLLPLLLSQLQTLDFLCQP